MSGVYAYRYLLWTLGATLCLLAVARYVALSSNVADLGFFLNNLESIDSQWQRAFYGHAQPLMLLWGVWYQALPGTVALMVLLGLQALALLGSVIGVWRVFGPWPGAAMLLYYPLWTNALFDFHFDHLAVPLLAAFFIACERRRFGWATFAAATLVLIKEPFALQTIACGLYFGWLAFCLRGTDISVRLLALGSFLVVWGCSWFYGATHWVLPYFGGDKSGALSSDAFSWLGSSLPDMLWTLISQPSLIASEILVPGKLTYLAVVFGLLAFIPLLRPSALIVALPLLMIAMLSRLDNYYSYATHYTAGLIVPCIVAFRDGLPVAQRIFISVTAWLACEVTLLRASLISCILGTRERTDTGSTVPSKSCERIFTLGLVAWLLVGHWAFASSPISRLFWSDKVWSYSWRAYVPTEREAMMKAAMLRYVPADPDASVSTQNTVNWYHLAHRKVYSPFPSGVGEPHKIMDWSNRSTTGLLEFIRTGYKPPSITYERYADYVVLDLQRPWFIVDRGCDWLYGACRNPEMAAKFLRLVDETRRHYDTVFERDGFMILRRAG